jgi:hypothetical protein
MSLSYLMIYLCVRYCEIAYEILLFQSNTILLRKRFGLRRCVRIRERHTAPPLCFFSSVTFHLVASYRCPFILRTSESSVYDIESTRMRLKIHSGLREEIVCVMYLQEDTGTVFGVLDHQTLSCLYLPVFLTILNTMSSVVAVAGGTGALGRAIVEALVGSKKYTPLIFAREVRDLYSNK